jgi:hypothetical protein
MKTDNDIQDKLLADLFNEITIENPSEDFSANLLTRIAEEVRKEKRKAKWITCGQIAAGVGGIICLPGVALYLCTLLLPGFSFSLPTLNLKFEPMIFMIGLSVLLLLMVDTLFRKYIHSKSIKHNKQIPT